MVFRSLLPFLLRGRGAAASLAFGGALVSAACSGASPELRGAEPVEAPANGGDVAQPGPMDAPVVEKPGADTLLGANGDESSSWTDAEPEDVRPWSERTLESLTLREKVAQLMMPFVIGDFAPEGSSSWSRAVGYVEREGIGGVIMSVGSPTEIAAKVNALQRRSRIPLLVGADLETGAGFRMRGAVYMPGIIELGGATDFPALMALGAAGDPQLAYEMGRITAVEARAVGIHVPFAPVLDVNNNPNNPIINVRSFGEDPELVAELGSAFVRGVQDQGAIATGKHFP
ncbi:MAG TPA: glycoside hydrolase family 3 N-terminal domain-containing protein, partial [Longimicrobiales bacterium]|nr:glycoside hydrolase family 3 N-terminal domain-containing protein [Longimicrobiales bacterium]